MSCPCSAGECVLVTAVVFLPSPTDMYKRRRPSPRCCVVTLTHCELGISTTQLFFYTNYQHRHFPSEEENKQSSCHQFLLRREDHFYMCAQSDIFFNKYCDLIYLARRGNPSSCSILVYTRSTDRTIDVLK